jgi:hypothetical protein
LYRVEKGTCRNPCVEDRIPLMKTGFPCENLNTRKSCFYYREWVYCKDARSAQKPKEEESLILKTF